MRWPLYPNAISLACGTPDDGSDKYRLGSGEPTQKAVFQDRIMGSGTGGKEPS
jgi:hypothetical protein